MSNQYIKQSLLCGLALFAASAIPVAAQTCKNGQVAMTGSPHQYIDNDDGTVTDIVAGLIWQKCSLGQTYSEGQCLSEPTDYNTWQEALVAAQQIHEQGDGFRLPNIKELGTIVERGCLAPAIDLSVFPSTPSSVYWSNTIAINADGTVNSAKGRIIDFLSGTEFIVDENNPKYIRLVKPML